MIVVSGKRYKVVVPPTPPGHGLPDGEPGYEIEGIAYWYEKTGPKSLRKICDGTIKEYLRSDYPHGTVLIETDDGMVHECSFEWLVSD